MNCVCFSLVNHKGIVKFILVKYTFSYKKMKNCFWGGLVLVLHFTSFVDVWWTIDMKLCCYQIQNQNVCYILCTLNLSIFLFGSTFVFVQVLKWIFSFKKLSCTFQIFLFEFKIFQKVATKMQAYYTNFHTHYTWIFYWK